MRRVPPESGFEALAELRVAREYTGAAIVTRPDGRQWRLSEDSVWLLDQVQEGQPLATIARDLSDRFGRPVDEATARTLVISTLAEPGLVHAPGWAPPAPGAPRRRTHAWDLLPASLVQACARAAAPLAQRRAGEAIALAAAIGVGLLVLSAPLDDPTPWRMPAAWLGALALTALSFLFHELGHATALASGGGVPGPIQIVWREFGFGVRCRVLDASRLDRAARLRLDLAGVVAQGSCIVMSLGATAVVARPAPVLVPVLVLPLLLTVRQLLPTPRSDGDWWLTDMAGESSGGTFTRRPIASDRRARAAIGMHALAGGALALALAAIAARVAIASWRDWTAGDTWGAAAVALGAWVLAGSAALTGCVLLARLVRAPARTDVIRARVPIARLLRNAVLALRARVVMSIGRERMARMSPLLANLLADAFPSWSGRRRARLVRRYWQAAAVTQADHLELARGGAADEIRHPDPVRALVASRQGAVVCGLHLGPYYYPAHALVSLGGSVTAFSAAHVREQRSGQWESARRQLGGEFETVVAGDPRGLLRARRALAEGRLLFLLIDGQVAARGDADAHRTLAKLGTTEAWVRTAAAELAYRAGVPLLLAAAWREGGARRVVEFSELRPPPAAGDTESIAEATRSMFRWFEPFVQRHPEQYEGWVMSFLHWRETGAAPTATRADLDAAMGRARAALDSPRGRARLVTDPTRVGWMEIDGERYIVHGERRRVLAGDQIACALLDEARRARPVHELPRRVGASSDVVAAMLARLELAELVRIETP